MDYLFREFGKLTELGNGAGVGMGLRAFVFREENDSDDLPIFEKKWVFRMHVGKVEEGRDPWSVEARFTYLVPLGRSFGL